jgi:predicted transcriptional regulator
MKPEPQTDIVARLRYTHKYSTLAAIQHFPSMLATLPEAADEIERLRAELAKLERFLNDLAKADLDEMAADGGITVGMVFQKLAEDHAAQILAIKAKREGGEG